ncbi:type IV pilin protein [Halomonas sp. LR5S13]|uniref:type IV pilin protein n=1 Tax=Halomonas rhizosphaerae TaxID=3043296 RepID=UPI0024A9FF5E|nr:type IV pilin protein [Halomonas rhizosphaerae]MDI5922440.1 type IV pilin protein [Halomonas rhizosphaerae]
MTPKSTRFRPQGPSGSTRRSAGFTLIELLIAVAVIGILAAIAIPNYLSYLEGARRTDAHAGLMQAAQELERCYTANSAYSGCSAMSTYPKPSPDEIYTITPSVEESGAGFTVTASTTEDDGCSDNITINHQGVKNPPGCW